MVQSNEEGKTLVFSFDIPPSVNALYVKRRGKGLALTEVAKKYRTHVKTLVAKQLHKLSRFPVDQETVYQLDLVVALPSVTNDGWDKFISRGPNKGKRKAATKFKTTDTDNRIKFLQDCLTKSVGIPNDSQVFDGTQKKREDPDNPKVYARLRVLERDDFRLRKEDLWDDC